MKATVAILLLLGLVAAVSAAVLIGSLRAQQRPLAVAAAQPEEVDIAIARRDLTASSIVREEDVQLKRVRQDDAPAGAMRSAERVVGEVLISPMVAGQVFTQTHFARANSGVRLAAVLPDGMRAMSVTLNESAALEGLLYPGSLVDVLASFQAANSGDSEQAGRAREMLSTVLLEAVQVLAVQDRTVVSSQEDEGADRPASSSARRRVVTLKVDSKQAEALQLAAAHGSISLAMRNPQDGTEIETRGTLFSDLSRFYADRLGHWNQVHPNELMDDVQAGALGDVPAMNGAEAAPAPPPPPPSRRITVIRGMTAQTVEFSAAEGDGAHSARR
jgi:pilus assembly protein CpaB